MNDLEKAKKELMKSGKGNQIEKLSKSSEAARLGKMIDKDALKRAAVQGDQNALSGMLQQVLSTNEGKSLLKKISENFGDK